MRWDKEHSAGEVLVLTAFIVRDKTEKSGTLLKSSSNGVVLTMIARGGLLGMLEESTNDSLINTSCVASDQGFNSLVVRHRLR